MAYSDDIQARVDALGGEVAVRIHLDVLYRNGFTVVFGRSGPGPDAKNGWSVQKTMREPPFPAPRGTDIVGHEWPRHERLRFGDVHPTIIEAVLAHMETTCERRT
jgi:hypothetical protein